MRYVIIISQFRVKLDTCKVSPEFVFNFKQKFLLYFVLMLDNTFDRDCRDENMKSIFPYNENSAALKSCGAIIVLNDQRLIPILNVEQLCWVGNYFLITRLTSREVMVLLL